MYTDVKCDCRVAGLHLHPAHSVPFYLPSSFFAHSDYPVFPFLSPCSCRFSSVTTLSVSAFGSGSNRDTRAKRIQILTYAISVRFVYVTPGSRVQYFRQVVLPSVSIILFWTLKYLLLYSIACVNHLTFKQKCVIFAIPITRQTKLKYIFFLKLYMPIYNPVIKKAWTYPLLSRTSPWHGRHRHKFSCVYVSITNTDSVFQSRSVKHTQR
jgi:hypothetical protein